MDSSDEKANTGTTDYRGFKGTCLYLDDDSVWRIGEPLSDLKHQQENAPFEARQVYTCVLQEDPNRKYHGIEEAVVKVKYQIQGTYESICEYEAIVRQLEIAVENNPENEMFARNLRQSQYSLKAATQPVSRPNYATVREAKALRYLGAKSCAYTPHLLRHCSDILDERIEELAMLGGYISYLLMTKVPGRPIIHEYWDLSRHERDMIREAFKVALTDVWELGIYPRDSALRNIMWDKEDNKCFIIDFEDYEAIDNGSEKIMFDDWVYRHWGLAELGNCFGNMNDES